MLQQTVFKLSCLIQNQAMALIAPFVRPQFQPLAIPVTSHIGSTSSTPSGLVEALSDALWFAVPKKKVTRSKKRMKTTAQKRIRLKKNIITDRRTGELTLQHKLPFNWKDYLPKTD